jgi:uncharacterized membrane protein SpoIIM required for sporulation
MTNIFRFSQVRALQGEGFKLVDALRLAYKDLYYTQYRKTNNLFYVLETILGGFILSIPFVFFLFV